MQRKRVHSVISTPSVGVTHSITGTIDETNGANVHGLVIDFICEPENSDANANGTWALWCNPDEASVVPTTTTGALELETSNAFLWASGVWAASNQTPFCFGGKFMKTSRNCQNGARITLSINLEGVSAGNVRVRSLLQYFTKSL